MIVFTVRVTDKYGMSKIFSVSATDRTDAHTAAYSEYCDKYSHEIGPIVEVVSKTEVIITHICGFTYAGISEEDPCPVCRFK